MFFCCFFNSKYKCTLEIYSNVSTFGLMDGKMDDTQMDVLYLCSSFTTKLEIWQFLIPNSRINMAATWFKQRIGCLDKLY